MLSADFEGQIFPEIRFKVGLRHIQRKPIIQMFRAGEVIPFDVKPYPAIPFAFIPAERAATAL